jgi:thiamine-phosphate pyrophosphorylase
LIQIREKDLPTPALIELVRSSVETARETKTRILVNDRLDIAVALDAAGVHLGRQSLPARTVRECVPAGFLVGVSCHSTQEALQAEAAAADYVLLGPVFATPSKAAYGPPLGLAKLREVTTRVRIPVLALGGITVEGIRECLEAGACGVAGISLFQRAASLPERVHELRAQLCP